MRGWAAGFVQKHRKQRRAHVTYLAPADQLLVTSQGGQDEPDVLAVVLADAVVDAPVQGLKQTL